MAASEVEALADLADVAAEAGPTPEMVEADAADDEPQPKRPRHRSTAAEARQKQLVALKLKHAKLEHVAWGIHAWCLARMLHGVRRVFAEGVVEVADVSQPDSVLPSLAALFSVPCGGRAHLGALRCRAADGRRQPTPRG